VFVSSHQLGEVAQMADEVVVLQGGRLVTHTDVEGLTAAHAGAVRVRSAEPERLAELLTAAGADVRAGEADGLQVRGLRAEEVGAVAAEGRVVLHELVTETHSLEDVFLELTEREKRHASVA
jgi:ABC-2 type transport system ATP-binding protein